MDIANMQPVDRLAAVVVSQKGCKEDGYTHAEHKLQSLRESILEIQSKLGTKRMFHPNGEMFTIAEFEQERQKLKRACTWRQREYSKLRDRIKEAKQRERNALRENKEAKKGEPNNKSGLKRRSKIIGKAFSLLCDDVAFGVVDEFETDECVANYYLDKAESYL